jgi:hypothetical protein
VHKFLITDLNLYRAVLVNATCLKSECGLLLAAGLEGAPAQAIKTACAMQGCHISMRLCA